MPKIDFPASVTKLLESWWLSFWIWSIIHYVLGLTATIGTVVIAATKGASADQSASCCIGFNPSTLGILVAICTSVITFSKAGIKANSYIQAWRIVNAVKVRCEIDSSITEKEIYDAVQKAEEIIGKSD